MSKYTQFLPNYCLFLKKIGNAGCGPGLGEEYNGEAGREYQQEDEGEDGAEDEDGVAARPRQRGGRGELCPRLQMLDKVVPQGRHS